jgi:hypothetical protein
MTTSNLDDAVAITRRIGERQQVQQELKHAFKDDALDGGWKTALVHPLYLAAEEEIIRLRDQMKMLI